MEWEMQEGDGARGPFTEAGLVLAIERGLPATTLVRPVGREKWKPIGAHSPFAEALARAARPTAPTTAAAKTEAGYTTSGCAVYLVSFCAAGPVGFLAAAMAGPMGWLAVPFVLALGFVVGRSLSTFRRCGACAARLADGATVCPSCRSSLTD